ACMDGPIRSVSWVSTKTGQQPVTEVVDSNLPKVAHRTPTIRSRSIRSGTSEPPKPKVPVSLARRLLFPNLPPTTPLPPILTLGLSEDDPTLVELNKELYDFLALALRAFVQVWWGQITPRDRDLIPQITRVIIHVIQDIEQRASSVDLSNLVLHQIPTLVDLHVNDYRVAAMRMGTAFTNTSPSPTIAGLFHMLQPHVAIQTNQEVGTPIISEVYLRQLVENILKLSLPPEDWESETERCIVREILACVVLGNVFKKLAQPWFLHQIILGLLKPPSIQPEPSKSSSRFHVPSVQVLVIFVLSAMQTISSLALTVISTFQYIMTLTHAANRSHERRKRPQRKDTSESIMSLSSSLEGKIETPTEIIPEDMANEDILLPSLKLVGDLIQVEDRLPINTVLLLLRLSSRLCQPWLEKLIPFMLYRIISPMSLIGAIQAGKRALFPNDGWPGPAPAEPTIEEQLLLREQLEGRLSELCQPYVASVILGSSRRIQALTVKQALDPFSESAEINSHLLIMLMDLVTSELWPELNQSS
ncbi:Proteasome subunit A N-terminal signature Add an annotation, partial [Rhizoctonia solani]